MMGNELPEELSCQIVLAEPACLHVVRQLFGLFFARAARYAARARSSAVVLR
jgi:hypothetical protein